MSISSASSIWSVTQRWLLFEEDFKALRTFKAWTYSREKGCFRQTEHVTNERSAEERRVKPNNSTTRKPRHRPVKSFNTRRLDTDNGGRRTIGMTERQMKPKTSLLSVGRLKQQKSLQEAQNSQNSLNRTPSKFWTLQELKRKRYFHERNAA